MGMFELTPEKQQEWAQKYKEAAAPHVEGEVQAVGAFQRQGQWFMVIPGLAQIGAAWLLLYSAFMKKRAGGLPANFLLVVTPDKVHALKYRPAGYNIKVKGEVGVFNRGDIRVAEQKQGKLADAVTLEVSENGTTEQIKINANQLQRNPFSAEVLDLLRR